MLEFRLNEIETELVCMNMTGEEMDLTDSKLMNSPVKKFKSMIESWVFLPIKRN